MIVDVRSPQRFSEVVPLESRQNTHTQKHGINPRQLYYFALRFIFATIKNKNIVGNIVCFALDVSKEVKKMENKLYPLAGQQFNDRLAQRKIREFADMPQTLRAEVLITFFKTLRESVMEGTPLDVDIDKGSQQIYHLINAVQVTQNKKRDLGERLTTIAELDRRQAIDQTIGKKRAKVLNHLVEIEALRADGHSFPQIVKMLFRGKGKISVDYVKEIFYEQKKMATSADPFQHEQPLPKVEPPKSSIEPAPTDFIKIMMNEKEQDKKRIKIDLL